MIPIILFNSLSSIRTVYPWNVSQIKYSYNLAIVNVYWTKESIDKLAKSFSCRWVFLSLPAQFISLWKGSRFVQNCLDKVYWLRPLAKFRILLFWGEEMQIGRVFNLLRGVVIGRQEMLINLTDVSFYLSHPHQRMKCERGKENSVVLIWCKGRFFFL